MWRILLEFVLDQPAKWWRKALQRHDFDQEQIYERIMLGYDPDARPPFSV
jgi:hypothetical protein